MLSAYTAATPPPHLLSLYTILRKHFILTIYGRQVLEGTYVCSI